MASERLRGERVDVWPETPTRASHWPQASSLSSIPRGERTQRHRRHSFAPVGPFRPALFWRRRKNKKRHQKQKCWVESSWTHLSFPRKPSLRGPRPWHKDSSQATSAGHTFAPETLCTRKSTPPWPLWPSTGHRKNQAAQARLGYNHPMHEGNANIKRERARATIHITTHPQERAHPPTPPSSPSPPTAISRFVASVPTGFGPRPPA